MESHHREDESVRVFACGREEADRLLAYIAAKGKAEVEVRWLRQQTLEGNPSTTEIRAALAEAVARGRWADAEKKTFVCG